jgi:hypothetical protein
MFRTFSFQHRGPATDQIIDGVYSVVSEFTRLSDVLASWRHTQLSADQRLELAARALALRFDPTENNAPIRAADLLDTRRSADSAHDLWTVYNRVQEGLVRGGQSGTIRGADGRQRRTNVREIRAVAANTDINRRLFDIAADFAEAEIVEAA